jgi:hypothetical protein
MKRCNTTAVSAVGFNFFEFILLSVCIYIYKIHHITFVYGLLEGLKNQMLPKSERKRRRKGVESQLGTPNLSRSHSNDYEHDHDLVTPTSSSSSRTGNFTVEFESVIRETTL